MDNTLPTSEKTTKRNISDRRITAFSATKQDYGLQIKVSGGVELRPAQSHSENVIGIVEVTEFKPFSNSYGRPTDFVMTGDARLVRFIQRIQKGF